MLRTNCDSMLWNYDRREKLTLDNHSELIVDLDYHHGQAETCLFEEMLDGRVIHCSEYYHEETVIVL